jgi:hypothetical protein
MHANSWPDIFLYLFFLSKNTKGPPRREEQDGDDYFLMFVSSYSFPLLFFF